jgi:LmbE family N-acetylglucosaminyl deacetylase
MIRLHSPPRVLAIGAHPDDIELGAGGFLRALVRDRGADVWMLVLSTGLQSRDVKKPYVSSVRRDESIASARVLGISADRVDVRSFPDCSLHEHGHEIIRDIESLAVGADRDARIDLVLTHSASDLHADHRVAHESTLSALRDFAGTILLYQTPSTRLNGFRPAFFVTLDEDAIAAKERALRAHASQRDKAFMREGRVRNLGSSWALFLRLPTESIVEAFEVERAFY